MGNIFEVNNEGVEALRNLASRMDEIREEILGIAGNMQSKAEDNSDVLGPHVDSLITVCEEVKKLTEDSSSPIETLSTSCNNLATKYEEIISNDPFASSADSSSSGGTGSSGGSVGASGGSERGRETGDHETAPETLGKGIQEGIGEFAPASNPYDSDEWDTLKDVPFAGGSVRNDNAGGDQIPNAVDSFITDINGIKDTMSLSDTNTASVDMAGPYSSLPSSSEYERHHIPSKAALQKFGVDTDNWPCICLENEDHKMTDSYRGKQKRHTNSFLPDSPKSKSYKEETIDMIDCPGGFADLVRDEIYNIKNACGNKYDHSISQFIDVLCDHIKKYGIPKR